MSARGHLTRIPQQRRSIEKKQRVVEAAFKIFSEKGYHNATTPDIAREAGISTGSLYAYYQDKKELFLACCKIHSENIQAQLLASYQSLTANDLLEVIERSISILSDMHNISQGFHRQVMSLTYLDADVREFYHQQHESVLNTVIDQLVQRQIITDHGREKVFLAVAQIEAVSSEFTYNPRTPLHFETLIDLCKKTILTYIQYR